MSAAGGLDELVIVLRPVRARAAVLALAAAWLVALAEAAWAWQRFGGLVPPGIDRPVAVGLWAALLTGLLVLTFRVARQRSRAAAAIVFGARCVALPRRGQAGDAPAIPYPDVLGVEVLRLAGVDRLLVAVRGRLPFVFWRREFVEPSDLERTFEALRARIAAIPDGVDRARQLEARDATARALREGRAPLTWLVLAAIALGFWLAHRLGALGDPRLLLVLGANSHARILAGELDRLVTASFLHLGVGHLVANGLGLLLLGRRLEPLLGSARFGVVLAVSALVGNAVSAACLAGDDASLGASAGLLGLGGAVAWLVIARTDELPARLCLPRPFWIAQAALLVLAEVLVPGVDHAAHAGGFAAGSLATALATRGVPLARLAHTRTDGTRRAAAALAAAFALGIAFGAWRIQHQLPHAVRASARSPQAGLLDRSPHECSSSSSARGAATRQPRRSFSRTNTSRGRSTGGSSGRAQRRSAQSHAA